MDHEAKLNTTPTVADLINLLKTFDQAGTLRICKDKYTNEWETLVSIYDLEYYVFECDDGEVILG